MIMQCQPDVPEPDPAPKHAPKPAPSSMLVSGIARRVAFLMEVGWFLHVRSNSECQPVIIKVFTHPWKPNVSEIQSLVVDFDTVLDLWEAGLLVEHGRLAYSSGDQVIYRHVRLDVEPLGVV